MIQLNQRDFYLSGDPQCRSGSKSIAALGFKSSTHGKQKNTNCRFKQLIDPMSLPE
jgi:hypothetical protein